MCFDLRFDFSRILKNHDNIVFEIILECRRARCCFFSHNINTLLKFVKYLHQHFTVESIYQTRVTYIYIHCQTKRYKSHLHCKQSISWCFLLNINQRVCSYSINIMFVIVNWSIHESRTGACYKLFLSLDWQLSLKRTHFKLWSVVRNLFLSLFHRGLNRFHRGHAAYILLYTRLESLS